METGTIEYCIEYAKRHGCTITSEAELELKKIKEVISCSERVIDKFDEDGWDIGTSITEEKHGVLYVLMRSLEESK